MCSLVTGSRWSDSYVADLPRTWAFTGQDVWGHGTFQGRFLELVPYAKIVEVVEFASHDEAFAGEMRMTVSLADADGENEITILCEDIPKGIRPEDNELGCEESLQKLAALLE
jgi:uncharacterized protein YndB with AHSA1/START domain